MRVLYAILCFVLWFMLLAVFIVNCDINISDETFWLTLSIVTAGALAGGD